MALKWLRNETYLGTEMHSYSVFKYTKMLSETRFEVMLLLPEKWQETYEIDIDTREIISGSMEGDFTSHWIPTEISVGDEIDVWKSKYTVVSKNEEVNLPSINHGISIKCIELEHVESINGIDVTESLFYDVNTGIKVKNVVFGQGYSLEDNIAEIGMDNDKDGLIDCHELFVTLTNPKKVDTDGDNLSDKSEIELGTNPTKHDTDNDFWNDSIDIMPTNTFAPNAIIALVVILSIVGFFAYRFLKRRKVSSPSPQTSIPQSDSLH